MLARRRADTGTPREHDNADTHATWGRYAGDDFLVILGQEVTTRTGHWLALGVRPGQVVGRHLDEVHRGGGLCVVAHPHAPYDSGTFLYPYEGFDVVEVWNGPWSSGLPWQADNEAALAEWGRGLAADIRRRGGWRPAMGNSDAHLSGQIGVPHTVVQAEELTTDAVLAGIRAGRSWIAGSAAVELSFEVSAGAQRVLIGGQLEHGDEPAMARVRVSGVPSGTVSFHTGRGMAHVASLPGAGVGEVEWSVDAVDSAFIRVEVRHPGGDMAALSNPIILG
ncbi:CehA/McbA family metallohydrolase [Streptomyces sp. N50]|uniref:CehA/McbA family metallohydrolase n=1 Tax=Streptomyces sp. N50 TaxID=3081765 RepID=UPI0029622E48|nr:CehA/McbA family metallohydrolase [Streptomyces sp. N50]WOX10149.1 CehA/McbA family metallohydrolase [Streptomyces sp. N50]